MNRPLLRTLVAASALFVGGRAFAQADGDPAHHAPHAVPVEETPPGGSLEAPSARGEHGVTGMKNAEAAHGEHGAGGHGEHGAGEHGEHGEHGGGHDGHALQPINWLDFSNTHQPPYAALLLNFALLVGLYYKVGKKPVAEGLKKRRESVAKEIEEAQRMKREAEERAKLYQAKLEKLEDELADARAALVAAGQGERDRIVKEAEEKAERMQRDAEFLVQQELKQMRVDLLRETVDIAVREAEELLKRRVTAADQERLAEDFLAELASKNTRTQGTQGTQGSSGGLS
jgi:F-type H+-transporting ATPase subunit b